MRSQDGVSAQCELNPHLCGMDGIAHGGIVATLLDEASAWALAVHAGSLGVTTEMNVRFSKPVHVSTPLIVEAFVIDHQAKEARTFAQVRANQHAVLAAATCSWTLMSVAVAARLTGVDRDRIKQFLAAVHRPAGSA